MFVVKSASGSICTRSTSLAELGFASRHDGLLGTAVPAIKRQTAQPEWIYSLCGLGAPRPAMPPRGNDGSEIQVLGANQLNNEEFIGNLKPKQHFGNSKGRIRGSIVVEVTWFICVI